MIESTTPQKSQPFSMGTKPYQSPAIDPNMAMTNGFSATLADPNRTYQARPDGNTMMAMESRPPVDRFAQAGADQYALQNPARETSINQYTGQPTTLSPANQFQQWSLGNMGNVGRTNPGAGLAGYIPQGGAGGATGSAGGNYLQPSQPQGVQPYTNPAQPGWQYGTGAGGQIQGGLGGAGNVQGQVGNTYVDQSRINPTQAPVQSVGQGMQYMDSMQNAYLNQARARLDPQWQQRDAALDTQLANQGITPGSEAWNNAKRQQAFERNDAYGSATNQAILNSGAEAQRMQGMDINSGNFANNAAQQGYQNQLTSQAAGNQAAGQAFSQGVTQGQFGNAAQQQLFNQNLQAGQFGNAAQQQEFAQRQADAQMRNSAMAQAGQLGNQWGLGAMGDMTQRYLGELNAQTGRDTANIGASASMSNAAAGRDAQLQLGNRGLDLQQQGQDWRQMMEGAMLPINMQNAYMQGMYPGGMPQTPQYPSAPSIPGGNQYAAGSGQNAATGNFLGSMGGFLGNYFGRP